MLKRQCVKVGLVVSIFIRTRKQQAHFVRFHQILCNFLKKFIIMIMVL